MAIQILQFIHPWCDEEEFGRVMAVTSETSRFGERAMTHSSDYFRSIRKENVKCVREHINHRLWCCEQPDSSEPFTSTSDSDSYDFDNVALIDRADQRDQLSQTDSSNTFVQPIYGIFVFSREHLWATRRKFF